MADTVDAIESVAHLVGVSANAALTVGKPALAILNGAQRTLALFGVAFPPLAIVANDLAVAMPIIEGIAEYAPIIKDGLERNRGLAEMVVGVGGPLFEKLSNLEKQFPGLSVGGIVIDAFLKANDFTPQDARFKHGEEH
jgi:hypothetical protein